MSFPASVLSESSLDGGAGFAAIFGVIIAGSLSFKETCLATRPTSSFLKHIILAISIGMYSCFFLVHTTFKSHSFVLWLYFPITQILPVLKVAASSFRWKFQSVVANCFLALYAFLLVKIENILKRNISVLSEDTEIVLNDDDGNENSYADDDIMLLPAFPILTSLTHSHNKTAFLCDCCLLSIIATVSCSCY